MRLSAIVPFLSILFSGLAAGVYLGDRMGASFARPELSPSSFVRFQQVQHTHFLTMMPILLVTSTLASIVWLVLLLARSRVRSSEFLFLALGTLGLVAVIVLTRVVNLPINDQLMTWNAAAPPARVMELWAPWEKVNNIRAYLGTFAFACVLLAGGASTR